MSEAGVSLENTVEAAVGGWSCGLWFMFQACDRVFATLSCCTAVSHSTGFSWHFLYCGVNSYCCTAYFKRFPSECCV